MANPCLGLGVLAPFPPPNDCGDLFEVLPGHAGKRVRPLPGLHDADAVTGALVVLPTVKANAAVPAAMVPEVVHVMVTA